MWVVNYCGTYRSFDFILPWRELLYVIITPFYYFIFFPSTLLYMTSIYNNNNNNSNNIYIYIYIYCNACQLRI